MVLLDIIDGLSTSRRRRRRMWSTSTSDLSAAAVGDAPTASSIQKRNKVGFIARAKKKQTNKTNERERAHAWSEVSIS